MPRPGFADRSTIVQWLSSHKAAGELPRLVRRMILESRAGLLEMSMPAGAGISAGDWDGAVRATAVSPWVPEGLSLWELSVSTKTNTKADDDYAKRDATPDGSQLSECTYVQLIARPWTTRATWAKGKQADGKWKDVRALGLDELEAWMESTRATWAWFSEEQGLTPYGLRTAETWWASWSAQTAPAMPVDLALAGRQDVAERVVALIEQPGLVTLGGPSIDETCAFLAATAMKADESGDGRLLARLVFVDDLSAWRTLMDATQPLVIVPLDPDFAREVPISCEHRIVVPVRDNGLAAMQLPALDAIAVDAALTAAGMTDTGRAREAAALARRSLTALRRNLARNPALHEPSWATHPGRVVRAALLAGAWDETNVGDQEILTRLSGESYDSVREHLGPLADAADPFVLRVGAEWTVVSPVDAWLLLAPQVTSADLELLAAAVSDVLSEVDPAFELPEGDRWRAQVLGKVRTFSPGLRQALAATLAFLAQYGGGILLAGGSSAAGRVNAIVRSLFAAANADSTGEAWVSLSDVLPLLAEASPEAFLEAVSTGLSGNDPPLRHLFASDDGGVFGHSSHAGLLWALEALAWSPRHFGAAADAFARLDEIDPGGKSGNRPMTSLETVFSPYAPQTSTNSQGRLAVIDGLRTRHPAVAWKLLLSMLPDAHSVIFPTHEPEIRDWKSDPAPVSRAAFFDVVSAVVNRCIADAGQTPQRWTQLLGELQHLPAANREAVFVALEALVDSDAGFDTGHLVWNAARDIVGTHREFANSAWALDDTSLARLDVVVEELAPTDPQSRHEWLFRSWMPHLGDAVRVDDHSAYDALLTDLRRDAVREVDAVGGLDAVRRLAGVADPVWSVGVALADATSSYDDQLTALLDSDDASDAELAFAYLGRRFSQAGWEWLDDLLSRSTEATDLQKARALQASRDHPRAWNVAAREAPGVVAAFWKEFRYNGLGGEFAHVETVADGLLTAGRNAATIDFVGMYHRAQPGGGATASLMARSGGPRGEQRLGNLPASLTRFRACSCDS